MKLFFIIKNNEPNASGGGFYAIFKFAEFLAKRGHEIYIYAVKDYSWLAETENIKIFYRPSLSRKNRFLRKLDKLTELVCDYFYLSRVVKKFNPDWIFGVLKESAIQAVQLGKKLNKPVGNFIYECPPWLLDIYGQEIYDRGNDAYTRNLWEATRLAYLKSDLLFPNSYLSKNYNQKWLGISTINAPVHPGIDHENLPYQIPEYINSTKSVLYVGRLVTEKNVHHLLEAWRKIPTDFHLHIVGEGSEKKYLQSLVSDSSNITFHGFVSDSDLWERYKACDLLVSPSNFEGFGMPPMQALYFGKPCLVSDIPIFRSIYADYIDYFPVGDIEALANKIIKIINDPDYRQAKGQAGRKYILDNYTWSHAAITIENALHFGVESA